MQKEIVNLNKKVWKGIRLQELMLDILLGFFIFVIIFGIGFTFCYMSH